MTESHGTVFIGSQLREIAMSAGGGHGMVAGFHLRTEIGVGVLSTRLHRSSMWYVTVPNLERDRISNLHGIVTEVP